jgi:hypothetical protein
MLPTNPTKPQHSRWYERIMEEGAKNMYPAQSDPWSYNMTQQDASTGKAAGNFAGTAAKSLLKGVPGASAGGLGSVLTSSLAAAPSALEAAPNLGMSAGAGSPYWGAVPGAATGAGVAGLEAAPNLGLTAGAGSAYWGAVPGGAGAASGSAAGGGLLGALGSAAPFINAGAAIGGAAYPVITLAKWIGGKKAIHEEDLTPGTPGPKPGTYWAQSGKVAGSDIPSWQYVTPQEFHDFYNYWPAGYTQGG